VDSVWLTRYYVLFLIEVGSRRVHLCGITTNPVGAWVTQQARNLAAMFEDPGRLVGHLIRDRDTKFTRSFDDVWRSIGAEIVRSPVRTPNANGLASYCTSWCRFDGNSFGERSAELAHEAWVSVLWRFVEMLVLVVGSVTDDQSGGVPALDGAGVNTEPLGDLDEGEQAVLAEPVLVAGELMVAA
jgi:hypothetical protein